MAKKDEAKKSKLSKIKIKTKTKTKAKTKRKSPVKKQISKKFKAKKQRSVSKPEYYSETDSDKLMTLLKPYSKDKLVDLIVESAIKRSALYDHILEVVDTDVTHRKIFVHGLAWNAALEDVRSAFEPFGEIETCNVVSDRATGKSKGYGFVLFKTRKAASKALKEPQKRIGSRMTSCQLASLGSVPEAKAKEPSNAGPVLVKKYVGTIDPQGRSQVLTVEGHVLGQQGPVGPQQAQLLATVAAAQNLALFNQYSGLNSVYGGLLANPSGSGFINPALASALSHGSLDLSHGGFSRGMELSGSGQLGAMRGSSGSLLGTYGPYGVSMAAVPQPGILQTGQQLLSSRSKGAGGSSSGATSDL